MVFKLFSRELSLNSLPTTHFDSSTKFYGARAVSSVSGQGAIVQYREHLYELEYKDNKYSWTILPKKLKMGVKDAVMMTLPDDYTC